MSRGRLGKVRTENSKRVTLLSKSLMIRLQAGKKGLETRKKAGFHPWHKILDSKLGMVRTENIKLQN